MKQLTTLFVISLLAFASCGKKNLFGYKIGQHFGGGVIFYVDDTNQHGLIAAEADLPKAPWLNGPGDSVLTSASGRGVGTGAANTDSIVAQLGPGTYAAWLCHDLTLNGYSDWFLPSRDELDLLYHSKKVIGGFVDNWYWSSSDLVGTPPAYAANEDFANGNRRFNVAMLKVQILNVRPVRAF